MRWLWMVGSGALSCHERQQHVAELIRDWILCLCDDYLLPGLPHQRSVISSGHLWIGWTMVTWKRYLSTYVHAPLICHYYLLQKSSIIYSTYSSTSYVIAKVVGVGRFRPPVTQKPWKPKNCDIFTTIWSTSFTAIVTARQSLLVLSAIAFMHY